MKTKLGLNKAQKSTHQSLTKPFGKKLMSFVLCICMLIGVLATMPINVSAETSGACGDNLTWTLDDEGTLKISGTGDMWDWNGSAPWYSDRENIKTVIIQNGVTSIGGYAFRDCIGLTSINIPNRVTSIGRSAFQGCESLTSVNIPNSVTSIGMWAFLDCTSLTSVNIPNSVTSIDKYVFYRCERLTSINIPNSVTSIGDGAFMHCKKLTSVTIPNSVTYIGEHVFNDCKSLTSINVGDENQYYSSLNGNLYNKNQTTLIQYAVGKKDKSFSIPNGVTTIGDCAFFLCDSLTSVSMPDRVTSIGMFAFEGCKSLTSINIPNSVTSIGQNAFSECSVLTSINIPNGVTSIRYQTFSRCGRLASINIPNSVTYIGDAAFYDCESLTSINIPNSVTSIDKDAFLHCKNLTRITIPNSIAYISLDAFGRCYNLTNVYYTGSAEQWKKISIGSGNEYLTNAKIRYSYVNKSDAEDKSIDKSYPFTSSSDAEKNGSFDYDYSQDYSKPYYDNILKTNADITGDYSIKNFSVTVNSGKKLNISGKLTIENGTLNIQNGGIVTADNIEIKTKGKLDVNGKLTANGGIIARGGSDSNSGSCFLISKKGEVNTGNVALYDYAQINLLGKMYANSFLIQTKTNFSRFDSKGELWLNGDFTQKKSGALWWQSGKDNFCPSTGFSVILEKNGRVHNISFDTPEQSYMYNLYTVASGGSADLWEGNPTIKGQQANVTKSSLGYSINKQDKSNAKNAVKQFRDEMNRVLNGTTYVSLRYGISEFGGMSSETNKALEKYLGAYISGIDAFYPNLINVSGHTWYEKIPIKHSGLSKDVKFTFETVNVTGQKIVNVKYTYGGTKDKVCFTFFTANKNELANTIRKYATDAYSSAFADYFSKPIGEYVKNKKSLFADLIWDGVQNVEVVGTVSGKKTVNKIIKKGINEYLNKIEGTVATSSYFADMPIVQNNAYEEQQEYGISLLSDTEDVKSTESVPFSDNYLVKAIKKELGLNESDELTADVLTTVEKLNLSSGYITDLSGIEQCVNLKELDLSGNSVSDLTKLSGLTKLENLDLSGNSVSDISPLSGLTNLRKLVVKNNILTDLTGLNGLTNISDLDLSFNEISDITPLSELTNLYSLDLTNNAISDIASLAKCTNLKILYLGSNEIADITSVESFNFEKLDISNNDITSIDGLNVTKLTALDISQNNISDTAALSGATEMIDLNIGGNAVSDLSWIPAMPKLVKLNFCKNNISDITPISELTNLTELNCADNLITEFEAIAKQEDLEQLDLSNNRIEDFSFVSELTNLQRLAAAGCDLYSMDIENIPNSVVKLDLSCNSISDITKFVGMNNLTELNLESNYLTDISSFADINRNLTLNINGNDITDEQVRALQEAMNGSEHYINITNDMPDFALEDIYFVKDSVSVKIGDEYLQEVSAMPYNANVGNLIWSSSDTAVAEVDNGVVTGKNPGEVTITASAQNGEVSASYYIKVLEDMIQNISVNDNDVSFKVKNVSDKSYDSVMAVVGIYDDSDNIYDVKTVSVNNFAIGYSEDIQVKFDKIDVNHHIRVFLWESMEDIKPIESSKSVSVKAAPERVTVQ